MHQMHSKSTCKGTTTRCVKVWLTLWETREPKGGKLGDQAYCNKTSRVGLQLHVEEGSLSVSAQYSSSSVPGHSFIKSLWPPDSCVQAFHNLSANYCVRLKSVCIIAKAAWQLNAIYGRSRRAEHVFCFGNQPKKYNAYSVHIQPLLIQVLESESIYSWTTSNKIFAKLITWQKCMHDWL